MEFRGKRALERVSCECFCVYILGDPPVTLLLEPSVLSSRVHGSASRNHRAMRLTGHHVSVMRIYAQKRKINDKQI